MTDIGAPRRGIAWAGAVNLAAGAIGSVTGLVLAAVVGRQLGPGGAGTYFLVVAAFMILSNVAELGADTGLVRYVSRARATGRTEEIPHLVRAAVKPVVLVGLGLVAVASAIAYARPDLLPNVSPSFVVGAAVLVVLSSLTAVVLGVVRGLGDVTTYPALQNITLPLLRLGGIVGVLLAGLGVTAVLIAWLAPIPLILLVAVAVAWRLVEREPRLPEAGRRGVSRDFWSFSATRGVAAAVEILLEWADVLIVGALTSPTAAGIYAVATRCARAGEVVQQAARIAIGPPVSAAFAREDHDEIRRMYGGVTAAMIWVSWPFYAVLAVFSEAVLSIFGDGFSDGATALGILAMAMAVATAAGAVQSILLMGGRGSWQLADKTTVLVVNVALDFALVPWWGIEGAAVAWAIAILADTALVVWQVQALMGLRPQFTYAVRAALLAVGVAATPLAAVRFAFGPSLSVLLSSLGVIVPTYLVVGWILRARLGLKQ